MSSIPSSAFYFARCEYNFTNIAIRNNLFYLLHEVIVWLWLKIYKFDAYLRNKGALRRPIWYYILSYFMLDLLLVHTLRNGACQVKCDCLNATWAWVVNAICLLKHRYGSRLDIKSGRTLSWSLPLMKLLSHFTATASSYLAGPSPSLHLLASLGK